MTQYVDIILAVVLRVEMDCGTSDSPAVHISAVKRTAVQPAAAQHDYSFTLIISNLATKTLVLIFKKS